MSKLQRKWTEIKRRQISDRAGVQIQLCDVPAATIKRDLANIITSISGVRDDEWDKAIFVAKAGSHRVAFQPQDSTGNQTLRLTEQEIQALNDEREKLSSQRGIIAIIITVALAAFLQGHVQSSINAATLYAHTLGIAPPDSTDSSVRVEDYQIGAMNAAPFFAAAILGAPLSLPTNYYIGRRGSLLVSSVLIIASSLGSSFSRTWVELLGVRIIGGVGMGIKAISAPILASESASGFWRGSIMLTWQLWVAFGIMAGFTVNLVIAQITGSLAIPLHDMENQGAQYTTSQFILGAPVVPSIALFIAVYFCYESPRFYMREDSPNFNPNRALATLLAIRKTRLQALRDLILIRWSTKILEETPDSKPQPTQMGLTYASSLHLVMALSWQQYRTLFNSTRLRNAVWSTCTVALAQQLCGINVFAFYSNSVFVDTDHGLGTQSAMLYSFGYGAFNFFFGLGAMRTIDTAGRRAWLLATIPLMALFLLAAAVSFPETVDMDSPRTIVGIVFVFLFTAAYAPGLGPIPFTLASESFPLSHREAGASVAISINLFFAGVLTVVFPAIHNAFTAPGTLGFFSGMNIVALILVFLLVEETRRFSLEELDMVYGRPKVEFINYQVRKRLPYLIKKYIFFRKDAERPPNYDRYITQDMEEAEEGAGLAG